jgi:LPS sulfotransferase NodH
MIDLYPLNDERLDFPVATEPQIFYAICHTSRCGSHYLARELWRTGCLGAPLEYFSFQMGMAEMIPRLGAQSSQDYVTRLFRVRTSSNGVFGFKTTSTRFLVHRDLMRPIKFIRMDREDRESQAISLAIATKTQQWTSAHAARGEPDYTAADLATAHDKVMHARSVWARFFTHEAIEPYQVMYEDFCQRPSEIVSEIADYLGVDLHPRKQINHLPPIERQRTLDKVAA